MKIWRYLSSNNQKVWLEKARKLSDTWMFIYPCSACSLLRAKIPGGRSSGYKWLLVLFLPNAHQTCAWSYSWSLGGLDLCPGWKADCLPLKIFWFCFELCWKLSRSADNLSEFSVSDKCMNILEVIIAWKCTHGVVCHGYMCWSTECLLVDKILWYLCRESINQIE